MIEVKESTTSKNFYFTIYQHIKQGLSPAKICNKLSLSKQRLNYYISSLKHSGFIEKIGYGVWEIKKEFNVKEVKKSTRVGITQLEELKQDEVRGHAFQFVLRLPTNLKNWEKREEIFEKISFKFSPLILGGINRGQKINLKGRKVWLTNKSIIIYEKSSYFAQTANQTKSYAINSFISLIRSLERTLHADLSFGGKYKFKVSRQHYSLIKNALAKQYNASGERLQVYNDKGLWFLIDNSYNLDEAETVHPKTAVKDNEKVQNFFNGVKGQENYTPAFVVTSIAQNSQNLGSLMKEQVVYAENIKSHIKAIKQLGSGVKTQSKIMNELLKAIKDLKR